MNIVRKNIEFQRGQDPKAGLQIGSLSYIEPGEYYESLFYNIEDYLEEDDMDEPIWNPSNKEIILKNFDNEEFKFPFRVLQKFLNDYELTLTEIDSHNVAFDLTTKNLKDPTDLGLCIAWAKYFATNQLNYMQEDMGLDVSEYLEWLNR